ncbi:MAG: acetyltransferase [Candidatus Omnitrophota bacterium]|nr:acetyltransferase [Candidatus Omnitrophota bacterium]MDZ4242872.1 acetyltransferase [Candidatus Omnitrophota bacterium]
MAKSLIQITPRFSKKILRTVIFGAGGYAGEVLPLLQKRKDLNICLFVDVSPIQPAIAGIPVIAEKIFWENFSLKDYDAAVVTLGDLFQREKVFLKAEKAGLNMISHADPSAVVPAGTSIGAGTVIYPLACVQTGVTLGKGVLLNAGCTIGHDTQIENFVTVNPGANVAGNVVLKKGSYVGIGANIIEKLTIGKNAVIGAGAAVINNIPDNVVAVGVPAKVVKKRGL